MAPRLGEISAKVMLIYISEAHSDKWPTGMGHPTVQTDFADRLTRLDDFVSGSGAPLGLPHLSYFADSWAPHGDFESRNFENCMHAWPDAFVAVNRDKAIIDRDYYGTGELDAVGINDYTNILQRLFDQLDGASAVADEVEPVVAPDATTADE